MSIEHDLSKEAFQDQALEGVSRTFALTIPQLPDPLKNAVTNAYLLCRIADTIEDEPALSFEQKESFHDLFTRVVAGEADPQEFADALHPLLSDSTLEAEKDLIANASMVIQITHGLSKRQQAALTRCVTIMCKGMPGFARKTSLAGLANQDELDRYCYFVAGVVGEMLTDLFCDYEETLDPHRKEMMTMAVSFGQGLQMTNILKDVWEDRSRGACWLPNELFKEHGLDLADLDAKADDPAFAKGMEQLIGIAHSHLRCALRYTLMIPARETGLRRFCLWAIGMAVLTLRSIHRNLAFRQGTDVKISRRSVKLVVATVNTFVRSDFMLKKLFAMAASGLPLVNAGVPEFAQNGTSAESILEGKNA